MDNKSLSQLMNRAIQLLVQNSSFDNEADRKEIAEFHEAWKEGANYKNKQYLKYGVDDNGRAVLYVTTKGISPSKTPPDKSTDYTKL